MYNTHGNEVGNTVLNNSHTLSSDETQPVQDDWKISSKTIRIKTQKDKTWCLIALCGQPVAWYRG